MSDSDRYIQILEQMCIDSENVQEIKIDADTQEAILYAIKVIKKYNGDDYGKFCGKCKFRNEMIGKPTTEGTFWCSKHKCMTGTYSKCDDFETESK